MLFNSVIFLIFGALFFLLWSFIRKNKNLKFAFITLASFFFYGWWDWRFLFLIIGSGLLDYFVGLFLIKYPARKNIFLLISVLGNVLSLMAFKYSGFFAENLDILFSEFGIETCFKCQINDFFLITPVGISFYTFQSMSYTIDIYKGKLKPTKNLLHFFSYLSMFPQLVAGPIVRASSLLPQLLKDNRVTEKDRWEGLKLIVHGFFKKMVIADNLAPFVNGAFSSETIPDSSLYWWLVITAFAFQIYCDFSGYSDIARGLARWMGLRFDLNFNHPYISTSLKEFWTRWHKSLSSWFKDYIYIPLGGSKKGHFRAHINMWITMLVSGFWHGAAWTFIIWGAIHAFFLSIERLLKWPDLFSRRKVGRIFLLLIIMIQVWIAWVFFRADSYHQAIDIISIMFHFSGSSSISIDFIQIFALSVIIIREISIFSGLNKVRFKSDKLNNGLEIMFLSIIIALCIFLRGSGSEFIYFQF